MSGAPPRRLPWLLSCLVIVLVVEVVSVMVVMVAMLMVVGIPVLAGVLVVVGDADGRRGISVVTLQVVMATAMVAISAGLQPLLGPCCGGRPRCCCRRPWQGS